MGITDLENVLNEKYSNGEISLEQYTQMLEKLKISTPESRKKYLIELKNQGNDLAKEGKYEESLIKYDKALEIKPEYTDIWNNKALILKRLGRDEEAKIWSNKYKTHLAKIKKKKNIKIVAVCLIIFAIIIAGIIFIPPLVHVPLYESGDFVNNSHMDDPNIVYLVLNKTSNQYLVTPVRRDTGTWELYNNSFYANIYDFDLKYNNKIMGSYKNRFKSGDMVTNSSLPENEALYISESKAGIYLVLPAKKSLQTGQWSAEAVDAYVIEGQYLDENYSFIGKTKPNQGDYSSTTIPTPAPTVAPKKDPIIGVWRYRPSTGYDIRDRFNADGTWAYSIYSDSTGIINFDGRWITQGDNSYTVRQSVTGSKRTYKYNPAQNTIYDVEYPTMIKIPYQGDVVIDPYDSTL